MNSMKNLNDEVAAEAAAEAEHHRDHQEEEEHHVAVEAVVDEVSRHQFLESESGLEEVASYFR